MALQGTLEDFGIADIFQLIGQQQKTGVLVLAKKDNTVHIHFQEGSIVSAEMQNRDQAERLGQMMLEAGLLKDAQLETALQMQKKTLQKLGTLLVESQFITKNDLDEFIYLQTKETIYRLFRWNSGTYQFHQQDVASVVEAFQPISAEHILMDGFRIIDEWPSVRKKIGSFTTIYEKVPGKLLGTSGAGGSDLDRDLDQAFSSFQGGGAAAGVQDVLSPSQERVFELLDGKRDVQRVIAHSRLGEFECCHAMVGLVDLGWIRIKVAGDDAVEEDAGSNKRTIALYQDFDTSRPGWRSFLPRVLTGLGYTMAVAVFLGYLGVGPGAPFFGPDRQRIESRGLDELRSDYQLDRIRVALDVYFLEKGYYPKDLKELVQGELLLAEDLTRPWAQPYAYRSDGTTFRLEKPFF